MKRYSETFMVAFLLTPLTKFRADKAQFHEREDTQKHHELKPGSYPL